MLDLSIVIPARNEHPAATFTLQAMWDQLEDSGIEWETILVDNLSTDKTGEFCRERYWGAKGRHRVIKYTDKGSCWGARNAGWRASTGEIVALFDAHVLPSPNIFRLLVDFFHFHEDSNAEVCYVPVIWMGDSRCHKAMGYSLGEPDRKIGDTPVPHHLFTKFWGSWTRERKGDGPYRVPMSGTAGVAVRRAHLERIGGWPEPLSVYGGGEQWLSLVTWMLDGSCWIHPGTYVYHLADRRGYAGSDDEHKFSTSDAHFFNVCLVSYALGGETWWKHRVDWVTSDENPHSWKGPYRDAARRIAAEAKAAGEPYREWVIKNCPLTLDDVCLRQPWR